jgi:hypothetical protein
MPPRLLATLVSSVPDVYFSRLVRRTVLRAGKQALISPPRNHTLSHRRSHIFTGPREKRGACAMQS